MVRQWNSLSELCVTTLSTISAFGLSLIHLVMFSPMFSRSRASVVLNTLMPEKTGPPIPTLDVTRDSGRLPCLAASGKELVKNGPPCKARLATRLARLAGDLVLARGAQALGVRAERRLVALLHATQHALALAVAALGAALLGDLLGPLAGRLSIHLVAHLKHPLGNLGS